MTPLQQKIANTPTVDLEQEDLDSIQRIALADDNDKGITLEQMDMLRTEQDYSGKISLRVPKTLHKDLARGAKSEGISLNQYILYKLAK